METDDMFKWVKIAALVFALCSDRLAGHGSETTRMWIVRIYLGGALAPAW